MPVEVDTSAADAVVVRFHGAELFRYVFAPTTPLSECRKPYFHPLRTLRGEIVTLLRPHDHPWHHGLAMTCAFVSGENFWGGHTFLRGSGYQLLDNVGRQQHSGWIETRGMLREQLHWVTAAGQTWLREQRDIAVVQVHPAAQFWTLEIAMRLQNVAGRELYFGSPSTEGRPQAGYGGLAWRGPRSFEGGTVLAAGGLQGADTIMGRASPWLAYIGRHDGTLADSTLLFIDQPSNPRYPTKWFVRTTTVMVAFAFMFDEAYRLPPDATLQLRYRIVIADGAWSRSQIEAAAAAALKSVPTG